MICSFECTFCAPCADTVLHNVCPNCGGGFSPRPIRPATDWHNGNHVAGNPPSTVRRHRPVDPAAHAEFAGRIATISPADR